MKNAKSLYKNWLNNQESSKIIKNIQSDYSNIMDMVGFEQ